VIKFEGLEVKFGGVSALSNVDAEIDAAITGLIGPNGAGKTTVLNVLSGFVTPTRGRVIVDGQDLALVPVHRRSRFGVRRTFQTEQVVLNLSVWDNVAAVLDHVPRGPLGRRDAVESALSFAGIIEKRHFMGSDLAAADRRMLEIARCVVGAPKVIMMDEPGAGLSESESESLRGVIVGVPAYCGAQVLLVDHDVDLISTTCTKTLVLDFGIVIAYGLVAATLSDPRVRAAYLGEPA
jgi:branched-chain amino acid transport system ATP-binding protein